MLDCYLEQDQCRPECGRCHEKDQTIDNANDFLDEIVKQLYSTDTLNPKKLEHCLEELCYLLQVNFPRSDLQITRTQKNKPILDDWINFNNNYLAKLA